MRYCNRWLAIYLAYFAIRSHTAHTMARGGGEEVELLLVFLEAGGERKRAWKEEAEKKVWINKFLLYAYRIQWQINSIFYTYGNLFSHTFRDVAAVFFLFCLRRRASKMSGGIFTGEMSRLLRLRIHRERTSSLTAVAAWCVEGEKMRREIEWEKWFWIYHASERESETGCIHVARVANKFSPIT